MALTLLAAAPATAGAEGRPRPDAAAWVLLDAEDREVLAQREPHLELPMASATKLMTAYVARRDLGLGDVVTAAPYDPGSLESLMGLRRGEEVSVEDLLHGLLLASGNDAAKTLAVATSGSERAFVAEMNRTARELGLDETSYSDPIGFDGPGQFTTVSDLADLALLLREDPVLRRIIDTPDVTLTGGEKVRRIVNRNNLVRRFPFVNGVKTGYTDGAGYVLVGSASGGGATVVSALIGAPSELARDAGTLALLRYGISLFERERVLVAGEQLAEVAIADREVSVPVEASRGVTLTVRRDEEVEVRALGVPAELRGPIQRGEKIGSAVVTLDGAREVELPLLAARSEDAASTIEKLDARLPGERAASWAILAVAALAVAALLALPIARRQSRRTPSP